MNRLRDRRVAAVAGLAAIVLVAGLVVGLGSLGGAPTPTPAPVPTASPAPSPAPTATPSPSPSPSTSPSGSAPPSVDALLGADGRFTILLLGSDYRPAHPGNRTDTLMIVSIDGVTGQTAVMSIPRDTARFPLPAGKVYQPKVNGLYQSYVSDLGAKGAGAAMKTAVGEALGVEVDHYVFIGFEGVRRLVDAVGGVDVVLAKAVSDPYYWVTSKQRGVYFPAGRNHLSGERALIFARTRQGDNDYERARRQQLLVAAAVSKVKARGAAVLPALLKLAEERVRTDLPLREAARIWEIVSLADLATEQRVVLGPRTYANGIPGTASIELRLDVVRALVAKWMPVVVPPDGPSPMPESPSPVSPAPTAGG